MEETEYIYIIKQRNEIGRCKIGVTSNLERRLAQYNGTGTSKDNPFQYIFTAEVKNSRKIENAIKEDFSHLRETGNTEIYFYNAKLFEMYADYIKSQSGFIIEIPCEAKDNVREIVVVKTDKKSLDERGITRQKVMSLAQKTQNDEFYTRYEDIEKEIACYDIKMWKNKIVFCNCDDPVDKEDDRRSSAFALFFLTEFNRLKLKKLICTHYSGGLDLFTAGGKAYIFSKDGFEEKKVYPKNFTGSFDDPLSIKILREEADIVCTNPPFSRAADYWRLLIESGKKFLIISNYTNTKNDTYIPYFRQGLVWTGYNRVDWFLDPKRQPVMAPGFWYTNLPRENLYNIKRIVKLKDIPDNCKYIDDNGVLCVDRCWIPLNYRKPFAVSVYPILKGILELGYEIVSDKQYRPYKNGQEKFGRCLIRKKKNG